MVESCRLAAVAMARGARSAHVNMMDVPGLEEVDASPLTLNAVVKALYTALASQPSTTAVLTISVPKGPSKDLGGDRKQIKILQEGLRKQAVDTDGRFSQMVDQIERFEGLLRPTLTASGSWSGPSGGGAPQSVPVDLEVSRSAMDPANQVIFPGNGRGKDSPMQCP